MLVRVCGKCDRAILIAGAGIKLIEIRRYSIEKSEYVCHECVRDKKVQ